LYRILSFLSQGGIVRHASGHVTVVIRVCHDVRPLSIALLRGLLLVLFFLPLLKLGPTKALGCFNLEAYVMGRLIPTNPDRVTAIIASFVL
jgi:hypothetical protein